jgi:hypothetical protein
MRARFASRRVLATASLSCRAQTLRRTGPLRAHGYVCAEDAPLEPLPLHRLAYRPTCRNVFLAAS